MVLTSWEAYSSGALIMEEDSSRMSGKTLSVLPGGKYSVGDIIVDDSRSGQGVMGIIV